MKADFLDWVLTGMLFVGCGTAKPPVTVKEHFKNEFLIGAAIPMPHVKGGMRRQTPSLACILIR